MSFIVLKDKIIEKLNSITTIQQVEEYPNQDFNGFPAISVRTIGNTSNYETTNENDELYTFMLYLFHPIENEVKSDLMTRRIIEEQCDVIRDTFDEDEFLSGLSLPSGRVMIGIKPTVSEIDETDNGKYVTATIELVIRVSKNIS